MTRFHMISVDSLRMNSSRTEPSLDDRLEAMGRLERRRLLLRLATRNAHDNSGIDFSHVDGTEGELDPLVTMRHLHLPVLEEGEFIRWDRENQWVRKGPRFDELKPYLDLFREIRRDLPGRTVAEANQ